ncbi:cytochrome c [Mesobaculum littorinae]|uniref:Cytochrome c n=1 Tax=Mesobaculum littorinae TaxID=2486419 RepID=A0A438AMH4_9RHOB|nr:cytochrome c [Mesobaculum littorinae]RVV99854.1 cytochrome c [Mesobaculum littorinae]
MTHRAARLCAPLFAAAVTAAVTTSALIGTAGPAMAQDDLPPAVAARQHHMDLYGFNLALLGGMAKGEIDYDADAATGAAGNIAALAMLDQSGYWPEGTSSDDIEGTRALPAIWENMDDFQSHIDALAEAATALEETAGDGVEAVRAGMGGIGKSCGGCHEDYRVSR